MKSIFSWNLVAGLCVLAMAFAACAPGVPSTAPRMASVSDADILLRPPSDAGVSMVLRQTVTARWSQGEQSFSAAAQFTPTKTSIVGLTPVGTVAFVVEHDGTSVRFENRSDHDFPFVPARILNDVQRVFFPWQVGVIHNGWLVRQSVNSDGELVREFCQVETASCDLTVVMSKGDLGGIPKRAVLTDRKRDYSLTIETHELTALPR